MQIGGLKPALDELYDGFNVADSATDPIQIVRRYERDDDREIVGFIAAALAFGRVTSVLQSIERVLAVIGPAAGRLRAALRSAARRPGVRRHRAPLDARGRHRRAAVAAAADARSLRVDRGILSRGRRRGVATTSSAALDSFSTRALALDLKAAYGRVPSAARRLLFLSAAVGGLGLQAAESVPAVDGAARRAGPRRLAPRVARQADRAARHARDPRRPLPAPHDLHQPRLAHGARHHGVAAPARSGRSGQVRLLALPPRDDERVRVQPRAGGLSVSATWGLPATRAYTAAVSATIRSTVKRSCTRASPASPIRRRSPASFSARTIASASAVVIARRHEQAVHAVLDDLRNAAGRGRDDRPRAGHRVEQRGAEPFGHRAHREQIEALDAAEHVGAEPGQQHVLLADGARGPASRGARAARLRRGSRSARRASAGRPDAPPRSGSAAPCAAPAPRRCRRPARRAAGRTPRARSPPARPATCSTSMPSCTVTVRSAGTPSATSIWRIASDAAMKQSTWRYFQRENELPFRWKSTRLDATSDRRLPAARPRRRRATAPAPPSRRRAGRARG